MKTWSAESAFVRVYSTAAVVVQGLLDKLATVERITRPPRLGHDVDAAGAHLAVSPDGYYGYADLDETAECRRTRRDRNRARRVAEDPGCVFPADGAEQLAEREAEDEVGEALAQSAERARQQTAAAAWDILGIREAAARDDDTPNPCEPGLSDDELVAVRGLIQERYEDRTPWWGDLCAPKTSAPVIPTGAGAEPTPRAAGAVGASGEAVSAPPAPASPRSDDAAAEWVGWAVPAISTVLAGHTPIEAQVGYYCEDYEGFTHGSWGDYQDWLEHVAPLIAVHIQNAYQAEPRRFTEMETGHDMGASFASEMFPQHKSTKGPQ